MLRTRVLLHLTPFVLLILAVGGYGVVISSRLARNAEDKAKQTVRSTMSVQAMAMALSRMEMGLRLALQGDKSSSAKLFHESAATFEENLIIQFGNPALVQEDKLLEQLQISYRSLNTNSLAMLELEKQPAQRQSFEQTLFPRLLAMNAMMERIRRLNVEHALVAGDQLHEFNRKITQLLVLAVAVALVLSAYVFFRFGRAILKPIQSLTHVTRELGQGNLEKPVRVETGGELAELGNAFNRMAEQLKYYRQITSERIVRLHRTMESALASFPDPVMVLDREGQIELMNPAAREFTTRLGSPPTLPPRLVDAVEGVLRTETDFFPHSFKEILSFRLDGIERFFLPRILMMRGENHEPVGVAVVLHDVTRFRLLDDAKTNLVATVSHELKSPLTSVRMVLHLLLEGAVGGLTPKQDELVQTAHKDAERLLRILNDLLDLTRLEAGESGLHREPVSPADLVQSVCDEAQQSVLEEDLTLNCSVEPRLPPVLMDRQRISYVLHNFITNAIRHSPRFSEIRVTANWSEGGEVQFSVMDKGPGIPEEYQSRVFERFFRIPGQNKAGAGLGLSIAREIVIAHGGHIGVRSQPGRGSEFYLTLARADDLPNP